MAFENLKNEKILITGGAGFIGTALLKSLIENNHVVIFDKFVRDSLKYFPQIKNNKNLTVIEGDIRNRQQVEASVGDSTYVFHLAAIAGVSKYFTIPADVMEVNVIGTYNILEAIKNRRDIKAFIDFSTSESYGSNCFNAQEYGDVKMENLSEKRWTYATSKIVSEKFGMSYYWQYQVPFVGIRPFNIYGPGQIGEGVVSYFLNDALKNRKLKITGTGSQCRTFCYIDDFIHGLDRVVSNLHTTIGQSYNIGTNLEMMSMYSLAKMIQEIIGYELEINFVAHSGEDVMVRSPSIKKVSELGYIPKVDLREGLKRTLEWYHAHKVDLD